MYKYPTIYLYIIKYNVMKQHYCKLLIVLLHDRYLINV